LNKKLEVRSQNTESPHYPKKLIITQRRRVHREKNNKNLCVLVPLWQKKLVDYGI